MQQRVILVHGFNVSDGGVGSTGRLANLFRQDPRYEVIEFTPGWRGLVGVRVSNKRRAQQLAKEVHAGDILIGHSDGCNLIDMALHELSSLHKAKVGCAYFNPALDRDTALSPIVSKCVVFHTESDKIVWLSRWLAFHPWGEMGMRGYRATRTSLHDKRYLNLSYESLGHHGLGHSGVFKSPIAIKTCFEILEDEFSMIPKAIPIPE
jgi:hypothetical protein